MRGATVTLCVILCMLMMPYNGIQDTEAASGTVHQGPTQHVMFFLGDSDSSKTGYLSPAASAKNQLYELEIENAGVDKQRVAQFESSIGAAGVIPSGTWEFRIDYRVEGGSTGGANFTAEIEIGSEKFTGSQGGNGGIPFSPGREGTFVIDVSVDEMSVSRGDTIRVTTFMNGGIIWSNPDDNSKAIIKWGGQESASGLYLDAPLVEIEIFEPNTDGDVVYLPIRLHSEHATDLADMQEMVAKIGGVIIEDVPFISTTTTGVEIVYPWSVPAGTSSGTFTLNFTLTPQEGVSIESEIQHQIEFGDSEGGGGGWNFGSEPARTGGSTLDYDLDLRQSGDRLERFSTLDIDGAVSVWIRWGLDNIGNDTLDSTSWWREISAGQSSLIDSEIQDGDISEAEIQVLENHLISSPQNLADFLDRGLALDSTAILGATPFDIEGAIDVDIDLKDAYEIKSSPLQIRIKTATILGGNEITMIESFVRSQSKTYWTGVSLDARLSTNPTQGISGVYGDGIEYSYLRFGISENVHVSFDEDDRNDDFRVTITPAGSITDAPLVGLILLLIGMALTVMLIFRVTKHRMRIPVTIWLVVMGSVVSALYVYGIQMNLLFGTEGGTFVMGLLIVVASPKKRSGDISDVPNRDIPVIDCPKCGQANPVPSDERPLRLKCGGCGRTLLIE